ncbi:MAG: phosphodiester glycosidase family protein [Muribaculaceae bacterium]|nr:phosphodiester glycosidase family protein [Muribaculaceae bacterium]
MKTTLLLGLGILFFGTATYAADIVELNGKNYEITTLADRDLGPGVRYTRLRIPGYPLNVNLLRIDVTNPYNSVEVQQASEKLYSTESLVAGAKRNSYEGHVALAGANANFWCVASQPPYSDQLIGVTYNGNLKNGKIITETNCKNDKYNGGLKHTGITGISTDNKVYSSNQFKWEGWISSDATGDLEIYQCNKVVRDGELALYNSYYPSARTFRCVNVSADNHFVIVPNCATEVYLTMDEGEEWSAGDNMTFTVKDVKTDAGAGSLGNYDLALVGRGDNATALAKLSAGDKVTVHYNWIDPDGNKVKMNNLVGGNAQVLINGELTSYNTSENYNSQVYSRTGYGCNEDGTVLYIIVIDKATDPVYGTSAGCSTTVMCQIAMHYGCTSMTNFDAGGSAMMMVGDQIINKTTEGSPRAVANGMVAFSTAPVDNTVTRLEFFDYDLKTPVYATVTPRVIAFNQYGAVIDDNFTGYTLTCPEEAGACADNTFTAGGTGMTTQLTASYNGVTVTKDITIVEPELSLRIKPILIDLHREYPLEVTALVDGNEFVYDPAVLNWEVSQANIINIDERGVLTGVAEGTTEISGSVGSFTDGTTVTVEESQSAVMTVESDVDWKLSYTSTKNGDVKPKGNVGGFGLDFNVSSTRGPKITVAKDVTLYSLPDALEFTVASGTTSIKSILVSLQPANESRPVTYTYENELAEGTETTVRIDMSEFGDPNDLAFYPVTFKSLAFNINGPTGYRHLDINSLFACYNQFTSVETVIPDQGTDNLIETYYNLEGIRLGSTVTQPGLYIKVSGGKASKVIIK